MLQVLRKTSPLYIFFDKLLKDLIFDLLEVSDLNTKCLYYCILKTNMKLYL